jgi:hypothetical protein
MAGILDKGKHRMNHSGKAFLLGVFAYACCAMPAAAYVGPGAGITLIGAVIGLLSAVFLALFAVPRRYCCVPGPGSPLRQSLTPTT